MKRIKTWRGALHEAIEQHRRKAFAFDSQSDCAMFAADCVLAMTGEDLAADFRGRYSTQTGAIRVLKAEGFNSLADLVASHLEDIHPIRARVGDVAFISDDSPFGGALGIVIGENVATCHSAGIGSVPRTLMTRAFRVP